MGGGRSIPLLFLHGHRMASAEGSSRSGGGKASSSRFCSQDGFPRDVLQKWSQSTPLLLLVTGWLPQRNVAEAVGAKRPTSACGRRMGSLEWMWGPLGGSGLKSGSGSSEGTQADGPYSGGSATTGCEARDPREVSHRGSYDKRVVS